jgi:hypothetical protein
MRHGELLPSTAMVGLTRLYLHVQSLTCCVPPRVDSYFCPATKKQLTSGVARTGIVWRVLPGTCRFTFMACAL